MIRRIRVMYEKGDSYILDMMLKAESFSDFLNRADFMDLVMAYDRQQWKEFMENRKYIALCKEELEAGNRSWMKLRLVWSRSRPIWRP